LSAIALGFGACVVLLAGFVEIAGGVAISPLVYLLAATVPSAFAAEALVLDPSRRRFLGTALAGLVFGVALLTLYAVPWNSRKPFLRDLDRIREGMSREEVERIMAGYIRGTGWPASPFEDGNPVGSVVEAPSGERIPCRVSDSGELAIEGAMVFRHSEEPAYDSDWGVIHFRDGRVVAVRFMPD
jgi:hypothetical protein